MTVVNKRDVNKTVISLSDGSQWEAELDAFGNYILKKQIKPPESESEPAMPSDEEQDGDGEEQEDDEAGEEDGEPQEGEPQDSEGEPTDEELERAIKKIQHFNQYNDSNVSDQDLKDFNPSILHDPAFKARLSSVMLDNKYDRRLKGRTRGKLDMTRLYKVPTESRTIFTQKQAKRNKQYNVVLLVDESGSMSDGKSVKAAESVVFLADAFDKIGINVAVIGFNQRVSVLKEFGKSVDLHSMYQHIATMNKLKGADGNNDWDGLNRAYHMFDHAPKGENILIMLSDGEPASADEAQFFDINDKEEKAPANTSELDRYDKDTRYHLHHLVNANKHRVTSIGIGIERGGWQIPNHSIINNPAELKKELIKQLRTLIRRG
jgi:uncharacterized protein with von Willebrand factor type A (vWA) domain